MMFGSYVETPLYLSRRHHIYKQGLRVLLMASTFNDAFLNPEFWPQRGDCFPLATTESGQYYLCFEKAVKSVQTTVYLVMSQELFSCVSCVLQRVSNSLHLWPLKVQSNGFSLWLGVSYIQPYRRPIQFASFPRFNFLLAISLIFIAVTFSSLIKNNKTALIKHF